MTFQNVKPIFLGPNGLRAGWRLLVFFALVGGLFAGIFLVRLKVFKISTGALAHATLTPLLLGGSDLLNFVILCVVASIMGKFEHRRFSEYGLPWRQALGKEFWVGSLSGFMAISGTLLTMFLLRGFRITGLAVHGIELLYSLIGWGMAFLLVGLFEEFAFRGYLQYTLASGIGFWPAAFVISGLFGLSHAFNPGENIVGEIAVVLFGLLLCLFLRRTGNLWCAVGFHAAYDWGQMFYGVRDSGTVPYHNLFNSSFSGPHWLTGGTVGPEAGVLTPIALLVVALVFSRFYRENKYQSPKPPGAP